MEKERNVMMFIIRNVLIFILFFTISFAQDTYASFDMVSGPVDIKITDKQHVYFPLHFDGESGVVLESEKSRTLFTTFINSSFEKFKDWESTAKENGVKDFEKDISSKRLGDLHYFKYGSWQFKFGKSIITSRITINEDGEAFFLIITPKYTSSSNEYIKSDGGVIMLDESAVTAINKALSTEFINSVKSEEENIDALFN